MRYLNNSRPHFVYIIDVIPIAKDTKMKRETCQLLKSILLFVLVLFCSCQAASAQIAQSGKSRDMNPSISDEDLKSQVDGSTQFAFDLYSKLKGEKGNIFFSPYSISTALGMTWDGARENTEKQMADTLHFSQPRPTPDKAFNRIDLSLQTQLAQAQKNKDTNLKLEIANSIWAQKDQKWLSAFLDSLKVNYGAGIYNVDFVKETEKCRTTINKWVEDKTNNKIKELIKSGVLDSMTRMVLVNAIYFYGQWQHEFEKDSTQDDDFTLLDNSKVKVPLMHQTEDHRYMKDDLLQAVELNYKDCDLSMLVLLPDVDKFAELESKLDSALIKNVIDKLESHEVILTFPKVKMDAQFELSQTLAAMGMPDAFDPGVADFSGMDGEKDLYISNVIHKAYVAIDEKGTEAAAATAVVMKASAAPMMGETVEFKADHPFIFLIRDRQTGSILFLGRVVDPR